MTSLDAVGSFVFALSGGMLALPKNFDLFGVLVMSFVVAVTGGVIRDLLIGAVPPAAIASWHTFAIAIVGGLLTFYFYLFVKTPSATQCSSTPSVSSCSRSRSRSRARSKRFTMGSTR